MDELLTTRELARALRVSVETVRRWAQDGTIPALRPCSNRLRFEWRAVIEAIRRDAGHKEVDGATRRATHQELGGAP